MKPYRSTSFGRRSLPPFLLWLALLLSAEVATSDAGPAAALHLGPLLGHTTSVSARIWIKATIAATSAVLVAETRDFSDARVVPGPNLTEVNYLSGVIDVDGLRAKQRYFYRIMLDGKAVDDPPSAFMTPPRKGSPVRLRLAVTSCEYDIDLAERSWQTVARASVDLVAQLGDNTYVDSTDPRRHREKFYVHRSNPTYRHVTRVTSTLAIWDDWDFAGDNTDGTAGYWIDKRFIEITSSPIAGDNHDPSWNPDEMLFLNDEGSHFVVLEVDTTAQPPTLRVEVHRVDEGLVRERTFSWAEVNGEASFTTCELLSDCRR